MCRWQWPNIVFQSLSASSFNCHSDHYHKAYTRQNYVRTHCTIACIIAAQSRDALSMAQRDPGAIASNITICINATPRLPRSRFLTPVVCSIIYGIYQLGLFQLLIWSHLSEVLLKTLFKKHIVMTKLILILKCNKLVGNFLLYTHNVQMWTQIRLVYQK